jgi:hypothetical protein
MDPVTILAAATAAYNGVKKAVELGREVSDIYGQLGQWAGHIGDLKTCIDGIEKADSKPKLFKALTFEKSETAEAFDVFAAKQKMKEMEDEIFHMFMYGELCHLGLDGYREFKRMRQEIHDKRQKMIMDQIKLRKDFIYNIKIGSAIIIASILSLLIIWGTIEIIVGNGKQENAKITSKKL